jgi:hypothetical protein
MMVGDYVLSFRDDKRSLREPLSLSRVLRRLAETLPYTGDNSFRSQATKEDVRTFIAERHQSELLFLPLPSPA